MSVKVRPYRGKQDVFEVDIRFEWPEGGEFHERVKAPVSTLSAARRWGEQREREVFAQTKHALEAKEVEEQQAAEKQRTARIPTVEGRCRQERVARSGHAAEGGRNREVKLTQRLLKALKPHRHLRGDRVLLLDDGTGFNRETFRKWTMRVEREAKLPETGRFHIFRHTFCAHLAMRGAPTKAIQELAGHVDLTTTMRYMQLSPAARDGAIALLDRAHSEGVNTVSGRDTSSENARSFGEMLEKDRA